MRTLLAFAVLLVASTASAQTKSVFIDELTWPEMREAQAAGKTSAFPVSAAGPESATGTNGNPSLATIEMGRVFLGYKIADGVEQIQKLTAAK